jgi:hypothetical protein
VDSNTYVFYISKLIKDADSNKVELFMPQETVKKSKDLSDTLRKTLKKHSGTAVDFAAKHLDSEDNIKILTEYLEAIRDKEIGTDKLDYEPTNIPELQRQHEQNEYHRPKATEPGTLFRGDFMDTEGERISKLSFLTHRFEEYSYIKSSVSFLFDCILS